RLSPGSVHEVEHGIVRFQELSDIISQSPELLVSAPRSGDFCSIFLIAYAGAVRTASSFSFRTAVSAGIASLAPGPISASAAAAVGWIPRFLSVSASTRAGTAGLAAAPSCREACVGSLRFLHELSAQRSFLQVLVKESHGLFDGFGPFFGPVRR